jgi:SAM-dependent methyltransferase
MDEAVRYNRYILDRLLDWAREKRRILDFGAGNGRFAVALARERFDVDAIESDPVLRDRIAAQGVTTHASLASLEREEFDGIYSLNVLEHIQDDEGVLAQFESHIRPGGSLFVYVPAFDALFSSNDARVGHVRRYRRDDLVAKFERAGFRVDLARYVDSIGFAAALVYRFFGSRDGDLNPRAVRFYDRCLFPLSCALDRIVRFSFGKNLLVVAHKPNGSSFP